MTHFSQLGHGSDCTVATWIWNLNIEQCKKYLIYIFSIIFCDICQYLQLSYQKQRQGGFCNIGQNTNFEDTLVRNDNRVTNQVTGQVKCRTTSLADKEYVQEVLHPFPRIKSFLFNSNPLSPAQTKWSFSF